MRLARGITVAASLLVALALVPAAQAGSFNVTTCGAAPGAVNNSWASFNGNATYWETGNLCSNGGLPGLYADDLLTATSNIPQGTEAGWKFTAPAGTTITAATVNRDFFKHDNNYLVFVRDAAGTLLDSGCTIGVSQTSCNVTGSKSWNALSTTSIAVGAQCQNNPNTVCINGTTLHDVHAQLASATVTLSESTTPSITSSGGPMFAAGWHSGTLNGTLSVDDDTGIQYVRVYVDNALANTVGLSCNFTFAVPCSPATSVNVSLNTASFSDGSHQVQLAAVDPAGNEARSSAVGVNFDNTAPGPPVGMSSVNATSGPVNVTWTNPFQGVGSPIAKVHWQACKNGVGCSALQTQTSSLTSLAFDPRTTAPFSSSPNGSYTISVWLEDAAGNTDKANAAAIGVAYGLVTATPGANTPTAAKAPLVKKRRRRCVAAHPRHPGRAAAAKHVGRHRARCLMTRHRSHSKR